MDKPRFPPPVPAIAAVIRSPVVRALREATLNVLLIVLISALPFIIALDLQRAYRQFGEAYHNLISLLLTANIAEGLNRELQNYLTPKPHDASTRAESLLGRPLVLIPAQEFPRRLSPVVASSHPCAPFTSYRGILVSFNCVVIRNTSDPLLPATLNQNADATRIAQLLYNLFEYIKIHTRPAAPSGDLPSLLFTFAYVPSASGYLGAIYPAIYVPTTLQPEERLWFSPDLRIGELEISRAYQDYLTRSFVVSLTRSESSAEGKAVIGFDISLPGVREAFNVYLLNGLLTLLGLVMYFRYYLSLPHRFLPYLLLSMSVVLFTYISLLANELSPLFTSDEGSGRYLVLQVLPFLPSGALLIVAGLTLFLGRRTRPLAIFFIAYGLELTAAILSRVWQTAWCWTLFGCGSLVLFGACLWKVGVSFSGEELKGLGLKPKKISRFAAIAYILWGLEQLSLVWLNGEGLSLLDRLRGHAWWGESMEILVTDSGIFMLLLYFKTLAVVLTVLFLSSLSGAYFRRVVARGRDAVVMPLDSQGRILRRGNLPIAVDLKKRESLANFVADRIDREELRYRLINGRSVRGFICMMPQIFGTEWIRLTIEDQSSDPRLAFLVTLSRADLLRVIDRIVLQELRDFAKKTLVVAEQYLKPQLQSESQVSVGRVITDLHRRLESEATKVLQQASEEEALTAVEKVLQQRRIRISELFQKVNLEVKSRAPDHMRLDLPDCALSELGESELLINGQVALLVVAECLKGVVSLTDGNAEQPEQLIARWLGPTLGDRVFGGECVNLLLEIRGLVDPETAARLLNKHPNIKRAEELLELFGGEVSIEEFGTDGVNLAVGFQYRHTSWRQK